MTWLAWRRHRLVLLTAAAVVVLLAIWTALVAHGFEAASCRGVQCNQQVSYGWWSTHQQAAIIDLLLFVVPCLVGIVLGTPLVAGELQDRTNRLAWTQGISRTRWLVVKWLVVGLSAALLVGLLQIVVQWWSAHVTVNFGFSSTIFGSDRIQPRLFNVTGIVPIAYTLFAFALGAALGAVSRRVAWAVAGTTVGYGVAAYVMVTGIRPSLASKVFVPFPLQGNQDRPLSWFLGSGFRYMPGYIPRGAPSADEVAQRCKQVYSYPEYLRYQHCLQSHHLQGGALLQPPSHYWSLQWGEAAIYVGAALVLFGLALWAVRRWRA
jgi:hypothetical protein